ncbi:MAG: hypothetical protein HYZ75_18350 [Elusimicrobia bacterium]|nr:hypothetical protein [Elusimicrobiota bacterium]
MLAALLSLIFYSIPASAGLMVSSTTLQVAIPGQKGRPVYHSVENLLLPPEGKPAALLRAVLTVDNEGTRVESGARIRFSLSARLRRLGTTGEGTWSIPFLLEDRHVPQIKRGHGIEVILPINRVAVQTHLTRLKAAGFWPDALRVEAAIEPRAGTESLSGRTGTKTISVNWKPR